MLAYSICFSLSDLLHSVWQTLGPSMLLQMALFHSFLWLSNIPLCIYMYHIFFIHSSVDEHLGCFHILAIVNSAALNIGVHESFWIMVFSRYMPRSRIAGSTWPSHHPASRLSPREVSGLPRDSQLKTAWQPQTHHDLQNTVNVEPDRSQGLYWLAQWSWESFPEFKFLHE